MATPAFPRRTVSRRLFLGGVASVAALAAIDSAVPLTGTQAREGTVALCRLRDFGARGDGVTDDTAAILRALAAVRRGGTLTLDPGTFRYSSNLDLIGGSGVTIMGSRYGSTVLAAADPSRSALRIMDSSNVVLRNLSLVSSATARSGTDLACGILTANVSDVDIDAVSVTGTANAGFMITAGATLSQNSRRVNIRNCVVTRSMSDGFHVTSAARDIMVSGNRAIDTGDDSFASIGYVSFGKNMNVQIVNNVSEGSHASGVAIEGTDNATVSGNTISRSYTSGIRVQSNASYNTGSCSSVVVSGNTLSGCKTGPSTNKVPALMVAANNGPLSGVVVRSNTISGSLAEKAIHLSQNGGSSVVKGPQLIDNVIDNNALGVWIAIDAGASDVVVSGNQVSRSVAYGVASTVGATGSLTVTNNTFIETGYSRAFAAPRDVLIDRQSKVTKTTISNNTSIPVA